MPGPQRGPGGDRFGLGGAWAGSRLDPGGDGFGLGSGVVLGWGCARGGAGPLTCWFVDRRLRRLRLGPGCQPAGFAARGAPATPAWGCRSGRGHRVRLCSVWARNLTCGPGGRRIPPLWDFPASWGLSCPRATQDCPLTAGTSRTGGKVPRTGTQRAGMSRTGGAVPRMWRPNGRNVPNWRGGARARCAAPRAHPDKAPLPQPRHTQAPACDVRHVSSTVNPSLIRILN